VRKDVSVTNICCHQGFECKDIFGVESLQLLIMIFRKEVMKGNLDFFKFSSRIMGMKSKEQGKFKMILPQKLILKGTLL
jgi:hypothetical protein